MDYSCGETRLQRVAFRLRMEIDTVVLSNHSVASQYYGFIMDTKNRPPSKAGKAVSAIALDVESFDLVAPDVYAPKKSRRRTARGATAMVAGVEAPILTEEDQQALAEALSSEDLARFYLTNEKEAQHFFQRSRDLFDEGTSIIHIDEELLLKKSSERVRYVRPLKLLQRQIHNTLLFVARPHMTSQDIFSVSLDYLGWSVEHNHNDTSYLKESVEEMQQSLMQISSNGRWFSTQILQDVMIDGKTLYYKIPPLLKKLNSAPERYYHVSLRMNARFRSKYAHAMYELLRENLWKHETGEMPLQEFRERMGIEDTEYQEFKRLSARVIVPALAELEEVSDYCATPKYITHGRKIVAINFMIRENAKNQLSVNAEGNLDLERFTILREELGISGPQIRELTRNHRLKRIEEVTDVLYFRYILKKKRVRKGLSLVTNALNDTDDKYFLTSSEKTELAAHREIKRQSLQEAEIVKLASDNRRSALDRFKDWWPALPDHKQLEIWGLFLKDAISLAVIRSKRLAVSTVDLTHPLVSSTFLAFVARVGLIPE
jgi:plasmid replication initiation protein